MPCRIENDFKNLNSVPELLTKFRIVQVGRIKIFKKSYDVSVVFNCNNTEHPVTNLF